MTEVLIHKIIRSRRKTLALQITADAALIVRAPERIALGTIHDVVRQKLPWILKKQRFMRETYRPPVKKEFVDGEDFLYLGEWYKLFIIKESAAPLSFNGKEFLLWEKHLAEAPAHFILWYRLKAREVISQRVRHYADGAHLKYNKIKISGARGRWGSCGPRGTLNFSWRLVMAPIRVVDYVVVHELAHLEVRNHSQKFWNKVKDIHPPYQEDRNWLKANERLLKFDVHGPGPEVGTGRSEI
jgi:hypothetical protein